jgi:CheY-like chemotaxis protein
LKETQIAPRACPRFSPASFVGDLRACCNSKLQLFEGSAKRKLREVCDASAAQGRYNSGLMRQFQKCVLLVDDDPADRKLLSHFLTGRGFSVIATGDPDKALQLIVEGGVGCFITDQVMKTSGHELVRIVKGVRSDIGIIFISGADQPSEPLPPEIKFINKSRRDALADEVLSCMRRSQL